MAKEGVDRLSLKVNAALFFKIRGITAVLNRYLKIDNPTAGDGQALAEVIEKILNHDVKVSREEIAEYLEAYG